MFLRSLFPGSRRRLLVGVVVLAGVLLWWGRTRQHDLDNRLIRAVRDGEPATVESRLREGANPNALEDQRPSQLSFWQQLWRLFRDRPPRLNALEIAVSEGRWLVASRLIEVGATVPRSRQSNALNRAAGGGADVLVEPLLQMGAPINATDALGCAAIWYAVAGGHSDVVETLLDHGAEIALVNSPVKSPADTAFPGNSPGSALKQLVWRFRGMERKTAVLKVLIRNGLDLDVRLDTGQTMLMIALQDRDFEFVEFLIEHGANLDLRDENGNTIRSQAKRIVAAARGHVPPRLADRIEGRQP